MLLPATSPLAFLCGLLYTFQLSDSALTLLGISKALEHAEVHVAAAHGHDGAQSHLFYLSTPEGHFACPAPALGSAPNITNVFTLAERVPGPSLVHAAVLSRSTPACTRKVSHTLLPAEASELWSHSAHTARQTWWDLRGCSSAACERARTLLNVGSRVSRRAGFHHVFARNSDSLPVLFDPPAAAACLQRTKVAILGASTMADMAAGLSAFVGAERASNVRVWRIPPHLLMTGIHAFVRGKKRLAELWRWADVLIINTVHHDTGHYMYPMHAKSAHFHPGRHRVVKYGADGHVKHELEKDYLMLTLVQQYTQLRARFRELAAAHGGPSPRIVLVFEGSRMVVDDPHECVYPQQPVLVRLANYYVASILSGIGNVSVLDLSTMHYDAKAAWFADYLHYGRDRSSGLLNMAMQLVLGCVCRGTCG